MGEKIDPHEKESRCVPPVQGLKKGEFRREKEGYLINYFHLMLAQEETQGKYLQ